MSEQQVYCDVEQLEKKIKQWNTSRLLIVCGHSYENMPIKNKLDDFFRNESIEVVYYRNFTPNPKYEEVVNGIRLYNNEECKGILAIGGGSAIDTAKCIKLFAEMNPDHNFLQQCIVPNDIKLAAIPTTAGSGSESTRFAVLYYEGKKQSIQDDSILPTAVLLEASSLDLLPAYHRKASFLDAYCHSIESLWSVNSTEESKVYSRQALQLFTSYADLYFKGDKLAGKMILRGANLAGRAINIAKTTAGHAMCYMLTSRYGIAHGYAAALCIVNIWDYMQKLMSDGCEFVDPRGREYLSNILLELEPAMKRLQFYVKDFGIKPLESYATTDLPLLISTVNADRLQNHPIKFSEGDIEKIYRNLFTV